MPVIEVKFNGRWNRLPSDAVYNEDDRGYLLVRDGTGPLIREGWQPSATSAPIAAPTASVLEYRPVEWRILED